MDPLLKKDHSDIESLLELTKTQALGFLQKLGDIPPHRNVKKETTTLTIEKGIGGLNTLELFKSHYADHINAQSGPNYYGFVIGGTTPAALMADWLVSTYDQVSSVDPLTAKHESDTIALYRKLFGLPSSFFGSFVSSGTTSNLVNLAAARQWADQQMGRDGAKNGVDHNQGNVKIFAAAPHSSIYKSLAILGMGRDNLDLVACLPNREAMDMEDLKQKLEENKNHPCIVISSAGTVNTGDFDDFIALNQLKNQYGFWLHIDGAFGGFAAVSDTHKSLIKGWETADSITIDAHKWLNVPYDAAFQFNKHSNYQRQVFQNGNAPYLEKAGSSKDYINHVPENSRRWRSLPAWFTLLAYGKEGYGEIVERHCSLAAHLGAKIQNLKQLELLSEVHLNIVCFTSTEKSKLDPKKLLETINASRKVYLTPTVLKGRFAIRVAISNWGTTEKEVQTLYQIIQESVQSLLAKQSG